MRSISEYGRPLFGQPKADINRAGDAQNRKKHQNENS
jgi:hypothetical protein